MSITLKSAIVENNSIENTWQALKTNGLVNDELPEKSIADSPWYIKLLLAISGWIAGLFFLGFLGFALEPIFQDSIISFVVGSIVIIIAYVALRAAKNEFVEHVALAISAAGQILITWIFFDNADNDVAFLFVAIFQSFLALAMPSYLHRAVSIFIAGLCLCLFLLRVSFPFVGEAIVMFLVAWLWLHEFSYPQYLRTQRAIAYGLVLALVCVKSIVGWDMKLFSSSQEMSVQPWMGELMLGAVMLYVMYHILKHLRTPLTHPISMVLYAAVVLLTLASLIAHGVSVGIFLLLLGFLTSNRILMGPGIISSLYFISNYYYFLDVNLLQKSISLLVLGLVLLALRWALLFYAARQEEVQGE